jgi:uncharacterized protein YdeI (YjbR/CyaY-like superfamily)
MESDYSKLKRQKHPMPNYIQEALEKHNLLQDYKERPAYQKNDYIGWIKQAKRQETKDKRLQQMLTELKEGGIYMKMNHPASAKNHNK